MEFKTFVMTTIIVSLLFIISVECAPLTASMFAASSSLNNQVEQMLVMVKQSNLTDHCELSQERKDLCEHCIRFVSDRQLVYLGCCKNYDGMHAWCQEFLNYSFEDERSKKMMRKEIARRDRS